MGRFRGGLRCIKYLLLGFNLLFWPDARATPTPSSSEAKWSSSAAFSNGQFGGAGLRFPLSSSPEVVSTFNQTCQSQHSSPPGLERQPYPPRNF